MGRPGSALDNAVIEAWHSTLEFELRRVERFATRAAARAGVAAWIGDYNQQRRHSSLQMMSPADYEQALQAGEAALRWARFPAAQYRPALGIVQVVPPWTMPALRPLDGSYRTSGTA